MAVAPAKNGYSIYTSEYSYGVIIQELIKKTLPKEATLTLGGGSTEQRMCPRIEDRNVTVINITLTAGSVADWKLHSVTFFGYGSGNEILDLIKGKLYLNSINGTLLDTSKYTADNGTIPVSYTHLTLPTKA